MSECANIEKEIKESLSETALNYFLNTTEKNDWIIYAQETSIACAITAIEIYAKPTIQETK